MFVHVCNYSGFLWWLERTSVYANKDFPLLHFTQLFTNGVDKQGNTHTHARARCHIARALRARALTRSSLVVSSFGIQLHPQSTRPPSRSPHEQSTYADSGCGAQHSGKKYSSINMAEDQSTRFGLLVVIYYFTAIVDAWHKTTQVASLKS